MSSGLVNKVLDVFGLGEDEYDILENDNRDEENLEIFHGAKDNKSKTISVHSKTNSKVMVCTINEFDEVTKYCDYLKENKMLIIDFKKIDSETAQRCVDFLSGALYTLNGYIQEISSGLLLLAPNSVDVSCDVKDQLIDSGMFTWVYKNDR